MIVYVTGAPGSGKTLWTIGEVRKLRQEWADKGEDRPVFYWFPAETASVSETLGWTRLDDANKCHECPKGSIIVVDEAWQPWPQGKPGKQPTELEPFATHRHRGHDFFIITQRTTSVHHFIRGLIARHVHFERQFGLERSRKFEWQKLGNPSDPWSKKEAMSSEFWFPKEVYALYKSSDMHTAQKKLPWLRLGAMAGGAVIVVGLFVWVFTQFGGVKEETSKVSAKVDQQGAEIGSRIDALSDKVGKALDAMRWAQRFEERAPGLPYSSEFYDTTFQPATVPKISGCAEVRMGSKVRCSCNTQQGTRITTLTLQQCIYYVKNGWFDPTRDGKEDEPVGGRALEPFPTQTAAAGSASGRDASGAAAPAPAEHLAP